jgi:pimeloyl-ACP methyl ester carboxylesterase
VLRYDKCGVGKSTGSAGAATTADFTSDAAAAIAHLRRRADVDPAELGLIGHSQGGAIAAILAAGGPTVAYILSLAGVSVPFKTLVAE